MTALSIRHHGMDNFVAAINPPESTMRDFRSAAGATTYL